MSTRRSDAHSRRGQTNTAQLSAPTQPNKAGNTVHRSSVGKDFASILTLLHTEGPKLRRVLAFLSAVGLKQCYDSGERRAGRIKCISITDGS